MHIIAKPKLIICQHTLTPYGDDNEKQPINIPQYHFKQ